MESLALLNEVKDLFIEFANKSNIDLQERFGTVEKFRKFLIAFTFMQLTEMGVEVKDAYDIVMGCGQYDALIEKVWQDAQK